MMKYIYIIIFSFIGIGLNAQERFFTFTERWMASSALEVDNHYAVIGTGFTPDYINKITITKINKIGEHIDAWDVVVNDAIGSEMIHQQALSCYGQQKIMGISAISESESLLKARRLYLNTDLTVVTDSSWQYVSPEGNQSKMFITYQVQTNSIIHGLNYHTGNTINSTLLSTDTLGNVIWESNFSCGGNSCWMVPRHIHPAHDGGCIFTHTEERNTDNGPYPDEHDVANIIKTDSLGIEQWRIHPGGEGDPYTSNHIVLQPTDDGNYLCAWADNWMKTTNVGHYNLNPDATIWFAKVSPEGNKKWEKNIAEELQIWGTEEVIYVMDQMIRLPDGNFALISIDQIIKINQNAEVIWARRVRPPELTNTPEQYSEFYIKGISVTSDGGFICTGELQIDPGDVYPEYIQTGFALKLDEYGCLEEGCQEDDPIVSVVSPQLSVQELSVYPNPASESVVLSYDLGQSAGRVSLSVTDVAGRIVHEQVLESVAGSVQVDTQSWASGVYLCRLLVDGTVGEVRRVAIIH